MPDILIGAPIPRERKNPEYNAYVARHRNVRDARGKAREYPCEHCGQQGASWAQIHGTDGESPGDYMPLCWPCHAKYDDFTGRFKGGRRKQSPETREKIRQAALRRFEDPAEREKARKGGRRSQEVRRLLPKEAATHCRNGHPFGPPGKNGKRACKICASIRAAEWYTERKTREQGDAALSLHEKDLA